MPTPEFVLALRARVGHALLHLPTVGVIARDAEGRVLLVQDREDGRWSCPGGIVEPFETPADAAVREAWEEAGVHVRLTRIAGVFGGPDCGTDYANGDRISWVATIFAAEPIAGQARPDGSETQAACFFADGELDALPMKPHLRPFLRAEAAGTAAWFEPPDWVPG